MSKIKIKNNRMFALTLTKCESSPDKMFTLNVTKCQLEPVKIYVAKCKQKKVLKIPVQSINFTKRFQPECFGEQIPDCEELLCSSDSEDSCEEELPLIKIKNVSTPIIKLSPRKSQVKLDPYRRISFRKAAFHHPYFDTLDKTMPDRKVFENKIIRIQDYTAFLRKKETTFKKQLTYQQELELALKW